MSEPAPNSGAIASAARPIVRDLALIVAASLVVFGYGLASEELFADESAYYTQTYFADLLFRGDVHSPLWLDYPAYDLPPLPKYAMGLALRIGGYPRPGPWAARAWYHDIDRRFASAEAMVVARWPSVLFGALGCASIYGLGLLARDRRTGALAALLLMVNPLYRLHARRAMSDVPAEALILASAALFLWTWRRLLVGQASPRTWLVAVLSGLCGGLATLAKLNGALAMMIVGAWVVLSACLPGFSVGRKLAVGLAALVAGIVSLATFVALNPFLTAHPVRPADRALADRSIVGRASWLIEHRISVSRGQMDFRPSYALRTPADKLGAVAVQGFGRFGPLGPAHSISTRRYDWGQDWGGLLWGPCVLAGSFWAVRRGLRQQSRGEPPTAWAVLVEAGVAALVVSAYLPLAWDRYFLSLQPGSALLAAGAVMAAFDRLAGPRGRA